MKSSNALVMALGTLLGATTIPARSGVARADEVAGVAAVAPAPTTSIGARVGGYGFRQAAGVERERPGDTTLDPELELAAQGQFYAMFDL